jgi:NAD-dependent deacetylase
MMKRKLVVFTGAGISAESGLKTFRDADGLWEGYDVTEVATPEAWNRNPDLVQRFYNERRKQVMKAEPNGAHLALAALQNDFDVEIITQNIDDLHERAGSEKVTHLHGVITYAQSSKNANLVYPIDGDEIKMGDVCELGSPLRPHVVWFGEAVPMMEVAAKICRKADVFVLIGSSLAVYPAAGLVHYVRNQTPKFIIDPKIPGLEGLNHITKIQKNATEGVKDLIKYLKI